MCMSPDYFSRFFFQKFLLKFLQRFFQVFLHIYSWNTVNKCSKDFLKAFILKFLYELFLGISPECPLEHFQKIPTGISRKVPADVTPRTASLIHSNRSLGTLSDIFFSFRRFSRALFLGSNQGCLQETILGVPGGSS